MKTTKKCATVSDGTRIFTECGEEIEGRDDREPCEFCGGEVVQ